MTRTVFKGAKVLLNGQLVESDLQVKDGIITEIGVDAVVGADESIDCGSLVIGPSFTDLHVHLRTPAKGQPIFSLDDLDATALRGGFTTVVAMANTDVAIDSVGRVLEARELMSSLRTEVCQAAAVTVARQGERCVAFSELAAAGVPMFSDDGSGIANARLMKEALSFSAQSGVPIAVHAVDDDLFGGAVMNASHYAETLGVRGAEEVAESASVARDIELTKATSGVLHVQHVTARETINLVRMASREGLRVTGEVTPHHLLLDDSYCRGGDPRFKVNPPLRSRATQMALQMALSDGSIGIIATDFAPHPSTAKARGFSEAAFGIVGLAEAFGASWAAISAAHPGSKDGSYDRGLLAKVLSAMSVEPARVLGRDVEIKVGAPANLVVIDPTSPSKGPLGKVRTSPSAYDGVELRGEIVGLVRGGVIELWEGRER